MKRVRRWWSAVLWSCGVLRKPQGRLRVMTEGGDHEVRWGEEERRWRDDPSFVEARTQLAQLLKAGYIACDVNTEQQVTRASDLMPNADVIVSPVIYIG